MAGLGALALSALTGASGASPQAHAAIASPCGAGNNDPQNPSNPLDSPGHFGTNPLNGANLFREIPWPFGGDAANHIATAIGEGGLTTDYRRTPTSWAAYRSHVVSKLRGLSSGTNFKVGQLFKIADQAQSHQFSRYTAGGSYDGIYSQVQNYLCRMKVAEPGASAVITTYFLKHDGSCSSGDHPNFRNEVNAMKAAVGNFSALIYVEEDAADTLCWKSRSAVQGREQLVKYEIDQLSQLPHALLYVEGGTSDANSPSQVAGFLNASGARKIRGFYMNDTHYNWAYKEIEFGNKVSQMTGGLHFIVDTRGSGQGPILNPHPIQQGTEQLCNPPNRGLGPHPGPSDGRSYGMYSKYLDGFGWVTTPGESTAPTCPGRSGHWAASGVFDEGIGITFATHANDRIGPSPRFKSRKY
jgi:hypothetical protein